MSFKLDQFQCIFFLKDNYNMLLIPQFEHFLPLTPNHFVHGRCQFKYRAFGNFNAFQVCILVFIFPDY